MPQPKSSPELAIYRVISTIPAGKVATYGEVAMLAGFPRGHRIAARALRHCPVEIPWWRVLGKHDARRAHIALTDPHSARGQRAQLETEGVVFSEDGLVSLSRFGWLPR